MGYMRQQLLRVMTTPGNRIRIRIWGDVSGTKTLEITPEMFDKIERLLIEEKE